MYSSEYRKPTLLRDEFGDYNIWVFPVLFVLFILLAIFLTVVGVAISDYYEVKAFNRIHETDYTFGEWFWAENTIKNYHIGPVENLNVDLNIKGLEGGIN